MPAVQFLQPGRPLFTELGTPAMDPRCCCGPVTDPGPPTIPCNVCVRVGMDAVHSNLWSSLFSACVPTFPTFDLGEYRLPNTSPGTFYPFSDMTPGRRKCCVFDLLACPLGGLTPTIYHFLRAELVWPGELWVMLGFRTPFQWPGSYVNYVWNMTIGSFPNCNRLIEFVSGKLFSLSNNPTVTFLDQSGGQFVSSPPTATGGILIQFGPNAAAGPDDVNCESFTGDPPQ